jgi:3D (Asp-Asp-Asp) domain-containing protein
MIVFICKIDNTKEIYMKNYKLLFLLLLGIVFGICAMIVPSESIEDATVDSDIEPIIMETDVPIVSAGVHSAINEVIEDTESEVQEMQFMSLGVFRITAYCSCKKCCGRWADVRPIDENGNKIVYGASEEILIPEYSVAVDPNVIPYGTRLMVNGKEYIAHDRGGAIKNNCLDIYFESHEQALEWGVQYIEVFVEIVERSEQ